ncbi:MAG TPA: hypothetical protein PKC30_10045 [Saprospiraceae bacterium]|nr:hypothetical protein [Saprospiraceae bacterium]
MKETLALIIGITMWCHGFTQAIYYEKDRSGLSIFTGLVVENTNLSTLGMAYNGGGNFTIAINSLGLFAQSAPDALQAYFSVLPLRSSNERGNVTAIEVFTAYSTLLGSRQRRNEGTFSFGTTLHWKVKLSDQEFYFVNSGGVSTNFRGNPIYAIFAYSPTFQLGKLYLGPVFSWSTLDRQRTLPTIINIGVAF